MQFVQITFNMVFNKGEAEFTSGLLYLLSIYSESFLIKFDKLLEQVIYLRLDFLQQNCIVSMDFLMMQMRQNFEIFVESNNQKNHLIQVEHKA